MARVEFLGFFLLVIFVFASDSLKGILEGVHEIDLDSSLFNYGVHDLESTEFNADGFHLLDFEVYTGSSDSLVKRSLYKRDKLIQLELENQDYYFIVTLKVGSNQNPVSVQLSMGTSDLWLPTKNVQCTISGNLKRNDFEEVEPIKSTNEVSVAEPINANFNFARDTASTNQCEAGGSFDSSKSTTWKLNTSAPTFENDYSDTMFAKGVWGTDSLTFGGVTIPGFSIAALSVSATKYGTLGIGLVIAETTSTDSSLAHPYVYENFPQTLVSSGYINKNVYSLYIGSPDEDTGQVLFGAVDHAKYTGDLVAHSLIDTLYWKDVPVTIAILLNSVLVTLKSQSWNIGDGAWSCIIDSALWLSHFPPDLLANIGQVLGATQSQLDGFYRMDCITSKELYLTFSFRGQEIDVPLINFQVYPTGSETLCTLGIKEKVNGLFDAEISLGVNFMQYVYTVYDLEDQVVALAQAKFTNDTDIEVISSTIPATTGAAQPSNTLQEVTTGGPFLTSYLRPLLTNFHTSTSGFLPPVATISGLGDVTVATIDGLPTDENTPTLTAGTLQGSVARGSSAHATSGQPSSLSTGARSAGAISTGARPAGTFSTGASSSGATSSATVTSPPKKNMAANLGVSVVFGILGVVLALI